MSGRFVLLLMISINVLWGQQNYIFEGSDGSGYASYEHNDDDVKLYAGGNNSGYAVFHYSPINKFLFEGGHQSGYSTFNYLENDKFLYEGGDRSGYSYIYHLEPFIWTGAIGQSWTVPGNWNFNLVPGIRRKTIIPVVDAGNFYPHVNAGLFAIGSNPNNGLYKSGELWIQEGALLVTRVNCRVENFGLITIDGEMNIKRDADNAFKNFEEGRIIVNNLGLFTFDD